MGVDLGAALPDPFAASAPSFPPLAGAAEPNQSLSKATTTIPAMPSGSMASGVNSVGSQRSSLGLPLHRLDLGGAQQPAPVPVAVFNIDGSEFSATDVDAAAVLLLISEPPQSSPSKREGRKRKSTSQQATDQNVIATSLLSSQHLRAGC